MFIFKTKMNYNSDTIVHILIYYQLMIMKRELVSQNVHRAHLNDMKQNAYDNATHIWIIFILQFLLAELNTFYLKFILYIPPPHFLCLGRLVFFLFLGAVVMRETFEFLDNP